MDLSKLPDYMKSPNIVLSDNVEWKTGKAPDYSLVDEMYRKEKTKVHPAGSMEDLVTNLIKNWEREASHKKNFSECRTLDTEKFRFGCNGTWFEVKDIGRIGAYNALIGKSELYDASRVTTSEESHNIFRTALKSGFAWECLEVYSSGLSKIAFKWRHWGDVDGVMKCPMRNGQDLVIPPMEDYPRRVEIFGLSIVDLDDNYKVVNFETFWNPEILMQQMVLN